MKQPKLYYFMNWSHHHFIWRIDENTFWIYDLCTTRYTEDRFKTLDEALSFAKSNWKVEEFKTYRNCFERMLELEFYYDTFDLYEEKDLVERESLHEKKSKEIQKKLLQNPKK